MSELAQVFAGTYMRRFTDQEVNSLMTSSRLNAKARAYMKSHHGVNYTEALAIVSGKPGPMLGGVMSDMLSRIVGSGTPTPDLESAMQSLGFEFPPKEGESVPVAASDVRTGDVVKVEERYGLLLDDKGTVLLDGKLVNITDVAEENLEFFRMSSPAGVEANSVLDTAKRYAEESIIGTGGVSWDVVAVPLYAIQRGDVLRFGEGAAVYLGSGEIWCDGSVVRASSLPSDAEVWRSVVHSPSTPSPSRASVPDGVQLASLIGGATVDSQLERWKRNEFTNHLHVPFGYDTTDNRVIGIDLAEAAMGGSGPHGCIQGTTGTGKTAFVRNILQALAADNSPTKVTFAFADFVGTYYAKEAAMFPHTRFSQGNMLNNEDARKSFSDFVMGEVSRREGLLAAHGARSHLHYTEMRDVDDTLPALPQLLVVMEEVGEALYSRASSVYETLTTITRKGRALGIHLLAVSQVVSTSDFKDALQSMGFSISFRTNSPAASMRVLGVTGAESLKGGHGDALMRYSERGDDAVVAFRTLRMMSDEEHDRFTKTLNDAAQRW